MPALLLLLILSLYGAVPRTAAAQPAREEPRFAVLEFQIEGNTVLAVDTIELAVTPFLGPDRTVADVEAARAALERAYQSGGFLSVFVDIPEQRVDQGLVRLRVTEGRVERLAVTGARYYDQGVIRERVPELAAGSVPNFNRVQEQLASAVREERQLQPVLRPGRLPGTVEAELKVNDRLPLGGSVELNNQHAAATEPWRLQANLHYDNLWQRDHALALTFITAPQAPEQSKVVSANYAAPLATDWSLLAYAVWSDSVVEPIGTSVIGQGFTLGLRAVRAIALGASSHTLSVGADFKDLKERLEFGDGSLSTPLRYLPLQVAYTGNWSDGRAFTSLNAQFVLALRGILQRDVDCPGSIGAVDQFACKREGGDGSFSHLRIDLRHTREAPLLPGTLVLRLAGQQAAQPLVSAEQFAIGGADSVRGYLEAEASGDRALLASVEWRSPSLWQRDAADDSAWAVDDVSMLGFVEAARVWTEQPSVGQHGRASLYAAGVGLRLRAARTLTAALDLAVPGKATASSPQRDPRLHLKLRAQF